METMATGIGCIWQDHRIAKKKQAAFTQPRLLLVLARRLSDINKVLELWANHCIGKTIIYERYKFNNRSQEQAESIDTCELGTLKDDLIRDRIVCGVRDNGIRRKLFKESGLSLPKCVDICRTNEVTTAQLKDNWRRTRSESGHPEGKLQEADGTQRKR